jgi:predicted PurR-regulated permease PerM
MREQLPLLLEAVNTTLKPWLAQWGIRFTLDVASIKAFAMTVPQCQCGGRVGSLLASLKLGGSVAFSLIGNAILIPVALFYLLMDWDRLMGQLA